MTADNGTRHMTSFYNETLLSQSSQIILQIISRDNHALVKRLNYSAAPLNLDPCAVSHTAYTRFAGSGAHVPRHARQAVCGKQVAVHKGG
jgi:hypothetical protein